MRFDYAAKTAELNEIVETAQDEFVEYWEPRIDSYRDVASRAVARHILINSSAYKEYHKRKLIRELIEPMRNMVKAAGATVDALCKMVGALSNLEQVFDARMEMLRQLNKKYHA